LGRTAPLATLACWSIKLLQRAVEITCWGSTVTMLGISRIAAPWLIRVADLWDVVFAQQPRQEGLCSHSVSVPFREKVKDEAVFVHRSP